MQKTNCIFGKKSNCIFGKNELYFRQKTKYILGKKRIAFQAKKTNCILGKKRIAFQAKNKLHFRQKTNCILGKKQQLNTCSFDATAQKTISENPLEGNDRKQIAPATVSVSFLTKTRHLCLGSKTRRAIQVGGILVKLC